MGYIDNAGDLEETIRALYDNQKSAAEQSEAGLPFNYQTYEQFKREFLPQFGIDPNTDISGYKQRSIANGDLRQEQTIDKNGNVVHNRQWVDKENFWTDFAIPAAALVGGAFGLGGIVSAVGGGLGGAAAGGVGASGAGASGVGGLGSVGAGGVGGVGGAGAVGTTGALGATGATALPTVVVTGTSTAGGLGSLGSLGTIGASAAGAAAANGLLGSSGSSGMSSADRAALNSNAGYGPGMSGTQTSLFDGVLKATGSTDLANMAANSGIGSWVSNGVDALGGWGNAASLVGGLLGGASGGGTSTSVSNQIDPRMAAYLYGKGYGDPNSYLGAAQQLYQQNKSGLNSTMQQGIDMQKSALTDPAYGQAYQQMRSLGTGLLGAGVAGNPFVSGGVTLPNNAQTPVVGGGISPSGSALNNIMARAGGGGGLLAGDRVRGLLG